MAYLITALVFGFTLLHQPLASGGWRWDTANALGFFAFAAMLYLFIDIGAGRRNKIHQWISYSAAVALVAHVAWFIATDPTVWHYLAWDASWYMLAGIAAFFCVVAVVILALPAWRRWWGQSRLAFRNWHYALSLLGVAGAGAHILGSGFYVSSMLEVVLYLLLCAVAALAARLELGTNPQAAPAALAGVTLIGVLFVVGKAAAF